MLELLSSVDMCLSGCQSHSDRCCLAKAMSGSSPGPQVELNAGQVPQETREFRAEVEGSMMPSFRHLIITFPKVTAGDGCLLMGTFTLARFC